MTDDSQSILFGNGDELPSNHTRNPHIQDVINQGRRKVVASGAAFGALAFLGGLPSIAAAEPAQIGSGTPPFLRRNRLPFDAVAVTRADTITVPAGYSATTFIPWGTPICGRYPAFLEDASNSAEDQAQQTGMHHDGMHFFPMDARFKGRKSDHGLLVLNHEYIEPRLLHAEKYKGMAMNNRDVVYDADGLRDDARADARSTGPSSAPRDATLARGRRGWRRHRGRAGGGRRAGERASEPVSPRSGRAARDAEARRAAGPRDGPVPT